MSDYQLIEVNGVFIVEDVENIDAMIAAAQANIHRVMTDLAEWNDILADLLAKKEHKNGNHNPHG